MTTVYTNAQRGAIGGQESYDRRKAAAAVNPGRLLEFSGNNVQQASAGSFAIAGFSKDHIASGVYGDVYIGPGVLVTEVPVTAGQLVKAGAAGKLQLLITSDLAGDTLDTSSVGLAFTNQPANDGIEVISDNAGDTTQTFTIYGTTTGTDTVVVETGTLNGTSQVATTKVDWGVVLGITLSAAAAGTVTFREASANQTIKAFTAGQVSHGLDAVAAATYAYNVAPTVQSDGATTKQVGLIGTNSAGTTIYDSQALNGTTAETMNSAFNTITYILTGDVESSRVVVLKIGAVEAEGLAAGRVLETQATAGGNVLCNIRP